MDIHSLSRSALSIDVLIVLAIAPTHIGAQSGFLVVLALLLYLVISLAFPLPIHRSEITKSLGARLAFIGRYALILIMAASVVVVPTLTNILTRATTPTGSDGFNPADRELSDSAIQMELAVTFLAQGSNPYVEQYHDTPLRFFQWQGVTEPGWSDPALDYFAYLPGNLLLSLPIFGLSKIIDFPYDQRAVFLLFYVLLLLILPHLSDKTPTSLALVAVVGLNPLFSDPVILGMNDVTAFLAILLVVLSLRRGSMAWAAIFMGIALALKQYTWFALPFFIWHVWEETPTPVRLRKTIRLVALMGGVALLIILPFFLWDPVSFYTDTVAYPAGQVENLYPIRGFTIGRLLMGAGIIPTFFAPFPFVLLQLLFGVPALVLLLRYQRQRGLGALLISIALFTFVVSFFSRFFHFNYLGVILALSSTGILISSSEKDEVNTLLS